MIYVIDKNNIKIKNVLYNNLELFYIKERNGKSEF